MAEYQTIRTAGVGSRTAVIDEGLRAHMNKVYGLMSVGMLITAAVAWAVGTSDVLMQVLRTPEGGMTILGWVVMFLPLIMVFAFGAVIQRASLAAAQLFFYVYAAVMGLSLAWIFQAFTGVSIAQTFLITAIAFAGLSLYGYTTKKDLSGFGTFLMMGVIGLVVAMIVNLFLASSALAFAISVIGVLIFAALTAYDTQNIKNTYIQHAAAMDQEWLARPPSWARCSSTSTSSTCSCSCCSSWATASDLTSPQTNERGPVAGPALLRLHPQTTARKAVRPQRSPPWRWPPRRSRAARRAPAAPRRPGPRAPSTARNSNDNAVTATISQASGASIAAPSGSAAPTAKDSAEATAATSGCAVTCPASPSSSRACAPSASCAVSSSATFHAVSGETPRAT